MSDLAVSSRAIEGLSLSGEATVERVTARSNLGVGIYAAGHAREALAGGNAATACGAGVNLGANSCQGGACP